MRAPVLSIITSCLFASSAMAADMNTPAEFDKSRFDWTGFFVGSSYGSAKIEDDDPAFPVAPGVTIPLHSQGDGMTWGIHFGYQFQQDMFVLGAEFEYMAIDMQFHGDGIGPIPVYVTDSYSGKLRAGIALNRTHMYGTFGQQYTNTNIGLNDFAHTAGVGIEHAINDHLVAGFQYDHAWYDGFDGRPIEGTFDRFSGRVGLKF